MDNVTRGYGVAEGLLAKLRGKKANSLIPQSAREGKILDIGCGVVPYFLLNTDFAVKHGLDPAVKTGTFEGEKDLHLRRFDITGSPALPYPDSTFDAVTMLAVFEHIEPAKLPDVCAEILRILKDGGVFILTTPAAWTDPLLRLLAKLRVLSPEEIADHKDVYTARKIRRILMQAGFHGEKIKTGHFELGLNLWCSAGK